MGMHYKAFISYSHRDSDYVRRLHRQLENWKIPGDLVGRQTPRGKIPANLRPIFRDRDDFAGGASLKDATLTALKDSEALIVVCSPDAAVSDYVNEEVRLFKALGRGEQVVPLIIAGEPDDPDLECFPPAVKYKVNASGQISDELAEPLAADAREQGDGRRRAVIRVVAGLLGLGFDELIMRAEQARRRSRAILAGATVGTLVFAAVFGAYALYQSYQANLAIERSVFAIGGLIQETDGLEDDTDIAGKRDSMLLSQCDLVDGLARNRTEVGPLEKTICLGMRAHEAAGRGDVESALRNFDSWYASTRQKFNASEQPSLNLATAVVRAALERYVLHNEANSGDDSRALQTLEEVSREAVSAHPESQYLHEVHEDVVWMMLDRLETSEEHSAALDLMERTARLRERQAGLELETEEQTTAQQAGVYLRRSAWFSLNHLGDSSRAIELADRAVAIFEANPAQDATPLAYSWQKALAYEVRGDARAAAGEVNAAVADLRNARQLIAESLDVVGEDEERSTLENELEYVEERLVALGAEAE